MLATVAHDHLKGLAALTNETAHLVVREGRSALFIDHATSTHVIAVSGQTGEHVPLYCSAHGKALLADFAEKDLKAFFGDKPLKAYTKKTVNTMKSLATHAWKSGSAVMQPTTANILRVFAASPLRFATVMMS